MTATDAGGEIDLNYAVGRIDPTNDAFDNSRKPLVAEFIFNGESVFVINNHFNSKIGDDPLFGANQPPFEETLAKRIEQAKIVGAFVDQLLAIDPDANVAVVGDLNDFGYSQTLQQLEDAGLSNLADLLPVNERYDYVFQGNSQELDHILVSGNLGERAQFDILHINAEFWDQTSDHDPLVARLNIESGERVSGAMAPTICSAARATTGSTAAMARTGSTAVTAGTSYMAAAATTCCSAAMRPTNCSASRARIVSTAARATTCCPVPRATTC
ncbi:hypothetical protein G7077_12340 [Sphingomonas piscis]|uniref:Endonuclease/exonuclease/phosphatase domain-containing protein n=1 Tax=Sphingomonas piscis TaxID=2714943 RepID=A0A6G7YS54_9SPHN|nr:hypothetical protein [Sphingomonas piscis]QIK79578.1 hypothetical protein G7077_12340 [Sphingomonas piscis]